ncbi:MAG: orotidine-5'-phosphate decarboxylase [Acidimicrobiales bacterium]
MTFVERPPGAREHLALALDVSSLDEAVELATRLRPWFSVAKVGLELFSGEGPLAVDALLDEGFQVFLDLKLHDIPTTVARAARRIGSLGVSYATVHAAGGPEMLRAAVEGFEEGWEAAVASGHPAPVAGLAGILAVTVLTSEAHADAELIGERASLASATGCLGVICAAADLAAVVGRAPGLVTVVPGIRLGGSSPDDQARVASPASAIEAGADILVVGRTVTASSHPEEAAGELTREVLGALAAARRSKAK